MNAISIRNITMKANKSNDKFKTLIKRVSKDIKKKSKEGIFSISIYKHGIAPSISDETMEAIMQHFEKRGFKVDKTKYCYEIRW
jgi:uncharacterized protein (DUF302 family)